MRTITFFAYGDPKGQPRPRAFARRMGGKFVARVYNAGTAEGWKSQVAIAFRDTDVTDAFCGPLEVILDFHFKRPKSHYNKSGLKPIAPARWQTNKPDCDNAAKAVLDALTQLGAWTDDAQVSKLKVSKAWSEMGGCGVTIRELAD
jgi:Holliday junction resolvase RusA-like endonuclease